MKNILIPFFIFGTAVQAFPQAFTNTGFTFTGVNHGGLDWGDYDNDGDLDLLISGNTSTATATDMFENKITSFAPGVDPGLSNFGNSDVMWCDYDNDGENDYVLTGNLLGCAVSPLVRNDFLHAGGVNFPVFSEVPGANLQEVRLASVDWGDYDNDGDQDLALSGYQSSSLTNFSIIYRNDNGTFVNIGAPLTTLSNPVLFWVDVDNDLDLDLHLSNKIYINNAGVFTDSGIYLSLLRNGGDADWGDYDNDGDLDLIMSGDSTVGNNPMIRLYRNDIVTFTRVPINVPGIDESTTRWGDYDNDGDLDILLSGDTSHVSFPSAFLTEVYSNQGSNVFTPVGLAPAANYRWSAGRWADYDNDGDLDFMITGNIPSGNRSHLFSNQLSAGSANTLPTVPTGTSETVLGNDVTIQWMKSTDAQTPQNGLTYNMYAGSSPGGIEIMSPMSSLTDGKRREAKFGNTGSSNQWKLLNLAPGTYYWGVQAIDQIFAGSAFSAEKSFVIHEVNAPTAHYPFINGVNVKTDTVYRWYSYAGAASYEIVVAEDAGFASVIQHDSLITDTTRLATLLELHTTYYWKVRAKTGSSTYSSWSTTRKFTTMPYFNESQQVIPGTMIGKSDFGDMDNDGDMDMALHGATAVASQIWLNTGGLFADSGLGPFNYYNGNCSFGDADNDNDLDVAMEGGFSMTPYIYINSGSAFSAVNFLPGGAFAWGDCDNDGDQDIACIGNTVYKNNGSAFTGSTLPFAIMNNGSAEWGDYDNDMDLDLLITGQPGGGYSTTLLQNNSGVFTDLPTTMTDLMRGTGKWGDYDSDGDLDIFIMGQSTGSSWPWFVYRNDGGGVFALQFSNPGNINYGDGEWGDYDNDGDLDLFVAGANLTKIYENNSGIFTEVNVDLTGVNYANVNLVDIDNDHDLDLFITGENTSGGLDTKISKFYVNNCSHPNTQPLPPTSLAAYFSSADTITFSWNMGSDAETPAAGLTYNFYLSDVSGTVDSMTPMADLATGYRKVVRMGNANSNLGWKLYGIPTGTYYWSVQSIDNCYEGSAFAPEQMVLLLNDDYLDASTPDFVVYPNPANDFYSIRYIGQSKNIKVDLYTLDHRYVTTQYAGNSNAGNELRFAVPELAPGVYLVKLQTETGVVTRKIVFK